MKYHIKIIVGYRRDQEHSIPAEEAHKAYYLFFNPDARTVFSNGLALKGDQIQEIVPDWQGTMGWNPSHNLDADDWNQIHGSGAGRELQHLLAAAKDIGQHAEIADLNLTLSELIEKKYPLLASPEVDRREGGLKKLGDIGHGNKN